MRTGVEATKRDYSQADGSKVSSRRRELTIALPLLSFGGYVVARKVVSILVVLVISNLRKSLLGLPWTGALVDSPRRLDLKARLP